MKYAPLIHSRTFHCDFNAKFAVRPEDFDDNDAKEVHKAILASTSDIDSLKGERRVVFTYNNHVITGLVCSFDRLKENNEPEDADKILYDKFKRKAYGFVGIVIEKQELAANIIIKKTMLWQILKKWMAPVWERTTSSTQLSKYENDDLSCNQDIEKYELRGQSVFDINVGESSADDDKYFYYYLYESLKGHLDSENNSFCSNMGSTNAILRKCFHNVTTSSHIISLLEKKEQEERQKAEGDKKKENISQKPEISKVQNVGTLNLKVIAAVAAIVIGGIVIYSIANKN